MKTYLGHINAVFTFLLLISCAANEVSAQSQEQIDKWIKQLESSDWRKREEASNMLSGLKPELRTDTVMNALIAEIERCGKNMKGMEEGEAETCRALFYSVAALQDDRAFPYYVRVGSPVALVKYGDKGIKAILEQLDSWKSCAEKIMVVDVLGDAINQGAGRYKKKGYIAQGPVKEGVNQDRAKFPERLGEN